MKFPSQLIFITILLFPLTTASPSSEISRWDSQRPNGMPIEKWNTLKATVTSKIMLTTNDRSAEGLSVSLSGDRALIQTYRDDGSGSRSVYVFEYDGKIWQQSQKLTANDGAADDKFNTSVSQRAFIGALRAWIGAYVDSYL